MPGKKGEKMIPRLSTSKKFHSLKELVFGLFEKKPTITKAECEKIVRKEYPKASFLGKTNSGGHFTWYKHRWNLMKLEGANFNIKEVHPKEEKDEASNERVSNEGKKGASTRAKVMDKKPVGKDSHRGKNRRVQIQPKKRRVVVKARKDVLQREGNSESVGQPAEDTEVHD